MTGLAKGWGLAEQPSVRVPGVRHRSARERGSELSGGALVTELGTHRTHNVTGGDLNKLISILTSWSGPCTTDYRRQRVVRGTSQDTSLHIFL